MMKEEKDHYCFGVGCMTCAERRLESLRNPLNALGKLQEKQERIYDNPKGKQPYKCPVCDGYGNRFDSREVNLTGGASQQINCAACRTTGVIWG